MVFADEIIHPLTGSVPLPGGSIPLYERFRELERPVEFYAQLKSRTEAAGLQFLCTPFGLRSAQALVELGIHSMKVASPELNHLPLLSYLASCNLPLILSSGVSTIGDIEEALSITGRDRITLLHCVTAYPAPPDEYNLRLLRPLAALFGIEVGVSDHSLNPVLVPALAVSQGATMIEKHITLSREGAGLDDPVALDPEAFRRLVDAVRWAESETAESVIETLSGQFTAELVDRVLGNGRKELAPSERMNYGRTNRSIHATHTLQRGATIGDGDIAVLRTEKILRPGLHPRHLPQLIGSRLVTDVPDGEGITWECIIPAAE